MATADPPGRRRPVLGRHRRFRRARGRGRLRWKAGFTVEETFPSWLYKAMRHGVFVDVIFRSSGGVYLDAEMLARGQRREYRAPTPCS